MMPETQVYTIARQMFERHGMEAIAHAARNALASEKKGDADEAKEWRHIEDAIKATELKLTPEELDYLAAPYKPHPILGH